MDDVKEKQSTEEYKEHAEIRKADYKKIRELVIQRIGDPKKVTKEDIQKEIILFYNDNTFISKILSDSFKITISKKKLELMIKEHKEDKEPK